VEGKWELGPGGRLKLAPDRPANSGMLREESTVSVCAKFCVSRVSLSFEKRP